jgi:hypothetical protein
MILAPAANPRGKLHLFPLETPLEIQRLIQKPLLLNPRECLANIVSNGAPITSGNILLARQP